MNDELTIQFDLDSIESYRLFLRVKSLPKYRIQGRTAVIPREYAERLGIDYVPANSTREYIPSPFCFDYQAGVSRLAIQKEKFAAFVECGKGKTIILAEYAKYVESMLEIGECILIVCPLMVIRQTINEFNRFYGESLPIERVKAADLNNWLVSGTGRIGITNYEALHNGISQGRMKCLCLDECFPAGTLVDCMGDSGKIIRRPIENVVCDDRIVNASGIDNVVSVHRREVSCAVIVKVGEGITCSPNHPFFTQRGWVGAQDLEPGDSISLSSTAMRMVRGELHSEELLDRARKVLREVLLSELADEPIGVQSEGSYPGESRQDGAWKEELARLGRSQCRGSTGTAWEDEFHVESRDTGQGICPITSHEPQTFRAWGEWDWFDPASDDLIECSWRQLDGGICCVAGPADSRLSHMLQNRLSESRDSSRYRGGWELSPLSEREGLKEGCETGFARVEGIEILESGDPRLERLRDVDGKLYFYDIEAERHPSFSVNGLLVHNSAMLKSMYGKWGQECLRLGAGLRWKLALTGLAAPNDRIEYANHAVFLDAFPNVNSFLAKFFVNRGQTDNRWEIKPHALIPFYRALSHWSIFLNDPAVYGWKDNSGPTLPIIVHVHEVDLTDQQQKLAYRDEGTLFPMEPGGITSRSVLSQIAKGSYKSKSIETLKPEYIKGLVDSWPKESTIIWCVFNNEQELMNKMFPNAANITGTTPQEIREQMIADFQAGRRKILISKGKLLGLGLNLQVATRHVFSGLIDSYETYFQCIKRSNRVGSTRPLNVHLPITEIERPMIETVLKKAARVESDTDEMERMFRDAAIS